MDQGSDALRRDDDRDVSPVDRDVYSVPDDRSFGAPARSEDVDTSDPDAIRANIERTRAEMGGKIDEIQDRLAPANLAEQAKEAVRDATIGRVENIMQSAGDNVYYARQSFMETVRSNPIPAAMVGIGLGWLLFNRRSAPQVRYSGRGSWRGERGYRAYDEQPRYYEREPRYYDRQYEYGERGYSDEQGTVGRAADRARETAGNVADRARETASDVADRARETASGVADRTRDTVSDLADRAQYGAQRVEDRFGNMMQDSPLGLGAVALAAGIAVGLALPQTDRENEWMGEARDRVVDQAQDLARDTMEKAKTVASNVAEEAQRSVQEQTREAGR